MKKLAVYLGVLCSIWFFPAALPAATLDKPDALPPGRLEMPDKSQESDCDCCQKCKAATKPMISHEESGNSEKTGCEQCCERCGRKLPSGPEEAPPDIIEKPQR
jgi:hypothetical protein